MNLRRTPIAVVSALTALAAGVLTSTTPLATAAPSTSTSDRAVLTTYAKDTWRSMAAMTDPATGLPADNINGALDTATRSKYTSPTNIGAYLWSTVVARDTGLISSGDAHQRMARTLSTGCRPVRAARELSARSTSRSVKCSAPCTDHARR